MAVVVRLRGQTELFALADRARGHDEVAQGAVGADGYGFALANQIESERFIAGGSKLTGLPDFNGGARAAGCVLTLTGGAVRISPLFEELFSLSLFCVAPDGAQDRLNFYNGGSGLALGDGEQLVVPNATSNPPGPGWQATRVRVEAAADRVAAAWERALAKVTPTPFELTVASDFGKERFGWPKPTKGKPRTWSPTWPSADAAALRAALAAAKSVDAGDGAAACRAIEEIEAARDLLTGKARAPLEHEYKAVCKRLWMPALDHLERVMRAASGFDLPREVDLLTSVLPYRASLPRARVDGLYQLNRAVEARRWAAHPWRF